MGTAALSKSFNACLRMFVELGSFIFPKAFTVSIFVKASSLSILIFQQLNQSFKAVRRQIAQGIE